MGHKPDTQLRAILLEPLPHSKVRIYSVHTRLLCNNNIDIYYVIYNIEHVA